MDDHLLHDIPTELTRQQSDADVQHNMDSFYIPGYRFHKMLNSDYLFELLRDDDGSFNWNYEITSVGFQVTSEGITTD